MHSLTFTFMRWIALVQARSYSSGFSLAFCIGAWHLDGDSC